MRKKILAGIGVLFLAVFFVSRACASFISGDIFVNEIGQARFDVDTDVGVDVKGLVFKDGRLVGKTDDLTSKKGGVWTFGLSLGEYDDILLDIHLPRNLNSISSISGPDHAIDIENKIITVIDEGALDFSVSYTLRESTNYDWLIWPLLFVVIAVVYFVYRKLKKKKERIDTIMPLINENEQKIIDILMKKPMRQKEIRKILDIPKASFSRYLVNLEKKKLILREGEGKNRVVRLK